ncbi:MAG: adenylate kinase, partial [Erysipelotrichaceae bacterium]|nr:adenylate kinase [Erysipelotrichaceae bacterium]
MIYLITGASHTGKTYLAQKMLEKLRISTLSQDHIKMGLIRSGLINMTVYEDEKLTETLWPVTREIMKTAVENHQSLIIEGCYVPVNWKDDFDEELLKQIQFVCLIMSESYINTHENDLLKYGDVIEYRLEKSINKEGFIHENKYWLD